MPLTACGYMVSGSISSPSWAAFHLSLTVLVHYRSPRVFSLGGWSPLLPTGFLVSRGTQASGGSPRVFVYRAITVCGGPFQSPSTNAWISYSHMLGLQPRTGRSLFGLGSSPFARHY